MMGKSSSQLRKNEDNTNISFYLIYLPKLHENVLAQWRLNLFKEIAISLNPSVQTLV